MQQALDKVDELAIQLKALLPMSSENKQKLGKKFRLEFNYNSNHLEGNTLTYGETELLLIFDDTRGSHTMREYEEMKAHDVAFHFVEEWAMDAEHPITEHRIKNLNEIILVRPFWKDAITLDGQHTRRKIQIGNYKEYPNSVRLANGEIFHYTSPTETPIRMQELIEWYRDEESAVHPVTLATMLHYKFVRIHPFDDGNGRVSRLLMNYVLLKNDLPPVIIKSSDKNNYLNALHLADVGDYAPFIEYIAEQLIWSLEISIKAAKEEDIEDEDDIDKEITLWKRETLTHEMNKNNKVVIELYKSSFSRLFDSFIEKMRSNFFELFEESKVHGYVNEAITNTLGKKYLDEYFQKINNSKEIAEQNLRTLNIRVDLLNPKFETTTTQRFYFTLSILLSVNTYTVQFNGKNLVEKKYNESIMGKEQKQIIRRIVEEVFSQLKLAYK